MSVPYTPSYAARILRLMPADRLAKITPADFQRWPAPKPLPSKVGRELINAERAVRRTATENKG